MWVDDAAQWSVGRGRQHSRYLLLPTMSGCPGWPRRDEERRDRVYHVDAAQY